MKETEFRDFEFMTAREKQLALARWVEFVESGFQEQHFTERIYRHLSLHTEFTAHFSRDGFYGSYFEDPEATTCFLHQLDRDHGFRSVEYGSTRWLEGECADINREMCDLVESVKERLYLDLAEKVRERDPAIAGLLPAKHGIQSLPQGIETRERGNPSCQAAGRR